MFYRRITWVLYSSLSFSSFLRCESSARSCDRPFFGFNSNICEITLSKINQQKRCFRNFWTTFCYLGIHDGVWNQHHFTLNWSGSKTQMETCHQFKFLCHSYHNHINCYQNYPLKPKLFNPKREDLRCQKCHCTFSQGKCSRRSLSIKSQVDWRR